MGQTKITQETTTIEVTTGRDGRLTKVTLEDLEGLEHWPVLDLAQIHGMFGVNGHGVSNGTVKIAEGAPVKTTATAVKKAAPAKKAPAKKAAPAKPANKTNAPATAKPERVYTRLSEEDELKIIGIYQGADRPTVRELANQFNVKQHTMQGWVNRLKKAGKIS
jgi:hypothetical protein